MKHLMRFKANIFVFSLCSIILMSACGVVDSDNDNNATTNGAQFKLSLDKVEVSQGGQFTATYEIRNTTNKIIEIGSPCTGIADIEVHQNEERVELFGSNIGCRTAPRTWEIGPKESLKFDWEVKAYILSKEIGQAGFDTTLVAPGNYAFRIKPYGLSINGESVLLEPKDVHFEVK